MPVRRARTRPGAPGELDSASTECMSIHHPLNVFFAPESVTLIGATERSGSVGRSILSNLIGSPFGGTVYPINPKEEHPRVKNVAVSGLAT